MIDVDAEKLHGALLTFGTHERHYLVTADSDIAWNSG